MLPRRRRQRQVHCNQASCNRHVLPRARQNVHKDMIPSNRNRSYGIGVPLFGAVNLAYGCSQAEAVFYYYYNSIIVKLIIA